MERPSGSFVCLQSPLDRACFAVDRANATRLEPLTASPFGLAGKFPNPAQAKAWPVSVKSTSPKRSSQRARSHLPPMRSKGSRTKTHRCRCRGIPSRPHSFGTSNRKVCCCLAISRLPNDCSSSTVSRKYLPGACDFSNNPTHRVTSMIFGGAII
jgi:hypothetical protein